MKKLICMIAAVITLFASTAFADVDLSGMTYDELVALKNQINLAMWQCEEWQEVTVPQGVWQVGVDIPAGQWTVTAHPGTSMIEISWGEKLSESGSSIAWSGRNSCYNLVCNPETMNYDVNYSYQYSFEVRDGDYIVITYGAAVFTPYVGKPSLNFK